MKLLSREADFACGGDEAGKGKLGRVGNLIEIAMRLCSYSDHRADIGDEAIILRTVVLSDRPRIRPGPEKQLQEAVVEKVEEARKGVVALHEPFKAFLGRA